MIEGGKVKPVADVALLAEGVDRNIRSGDFVVWGNEVALLAEGVDRNFTLVFFHVKVRCRPPRGGRG